MSTTVTHLSAHMRLFELIRQERAAVSSGQAANATALYEAEQAKAFQQLALNSFR
ncbi:MAG: hypothetical protein AAFQ58_06345 [Pseudomonadota bacterium]